MEQNQLSAKIALDSLNQQLGRANKLIEGLTDEQLAQEVAPGRNSGTYLLGHLAAVHDMMLPLLGIGDRMHPELDEVFIKNPDKSGLPKPAAKQLRENWNSINTNLTSKLASLTPEQWFERHTSVSEEDFKKEPHRNRLNVVSGRTQHLAYHMGQMAFLKN
jgi:hypothetical protein